MPSTPQVLGTTRTPSSALCPLPLSRVIPERRRRASPVISFYRLTCLVCDLFPGLAAGGEDYKLKIFDSDLVSGSSVVELAGHTDFINAVAFDNGEGNRIASTGDDSTVGASGCIPRPW